MKATLHRSFEMAAIFAMTLAFATMLHAQDIGKPTAVPAGQAMTIEGVILSHQADNLTVRAFGNTVYTVTIAGSTQLKEKKSNPFRGAKKYSSEGLVPGLQIEAKGAGNNSGALSAREIRFRNEDYITAQTMDTRVVPVEKSLRDTQVRLGETEQNSQRLSGQVQELSDVSNAARGGAKAAQESADNALAAASTAQSSADKAKAGVRAANERIALLDDFDVKESTTVYFNPGSAQLSSKDQSGLAKFAEQTAAEKGYMIEVAGFASSDGAIDLNRRLSQKRADAVIQYLAENFQIPVRRFVVPMGYGESHPVADNKTHEGRKENRRVEIRLLVSKGLKTPSESGETSQNRNQSAAIMRRFMTHRFIRIYKLNITKSVWICGLVFCLLGSPILQAQPNSANSAFEEHYQNPPLNIIRVSSDLVSVPVSVTDATGHMVRDLKIGDFRIMEDGRPVAISSIADAGQAPLNLALLFDLSGSVQSRFEFEQQAAAQFLKKIWKPGDAISIIAINEKPEILLHNCRDLQEALQELGKLHPTQSSTAFFDSVLLGARMLNRSSVPETRQAQIALSDGADNRSDQTMATALREIQQLDTMFYAVNPSGASIRLNRINSKGQEDLTVLAVATGGTVFVSDQATDLDNIFDRIATELRAQYLLSYYALSSDTAGAFHSIDVSLPNQPDLKIRARLGYRTDLK